MQCNRMDKQAIYDDLKKTILTLELEPGTALDEASLSEQLRISRTPLREILRGLAARAVSRSSITAAPTCRR